MRRKTYRGFATALVLALTACTALPVSAQVQGDDGPPSVRRLPPPGQPAPPTPSQPQARPQPQPQAQPPVQPQAQAQPQGRRRHHDSGVGAAIGAGVVGGIVGGALLNGQRQAPGYAPEPAYAPPPPTYDVEDEPECRVVRKPVYDEDGEIVDYRTRRICR